MPSKFEMKKAKNGRFYFNLISSNGEVILTSETYTSKRGAKNGIESVRANAGNGARFQKRVNKGGKPFIVLRAANHYVVGKSEAYSSDAACEKGMAAVAQTAAGAAVKDMTE